VASTAVVVENSPSPSSGVASPPAVSPPPSAPTSRGTLPQRLSTDEGTVFFGGSSYSGADIKAVVHIYDGGKAKREEINLLQAEQERILIGSDAESQIGTIKGLQDKIDALTDTLPAFSTKVLAEIQTLTISSFREKSPVRSLGTVYPKGFVRGPRSIAGSIIFTVFNQQVLEGLMDTIDMVDQNRPFTTILIDQLPPFDITIAFANEYGSISRMAIYGIELICEGQAMSVQDLLIESTVQYQARDFDPMQSLGSVEGIGRRKSTAPFKGINATSLLLDQKFNQHKDLSVPFLKATSRRNTFR